MFVALVGYEPDAASSEAAIFVRNRAGGWRLNKKRPSEGLGLRAGLVRLITSSWNLIYSELLRWETLLEKSSLIKHIPYALGTSYS